MFSSSLVLELLVPLVLALVQVLRTRLIIELVLQVITFDSRN